ncbi:hypothetical protein BC831DRAFT_438561, partial [Entophlyctis helioformis]
MAGDAVARNVRDLLAGSTDDVQAEYMRIEADIRDACKALNGLDLPVLDPSVAAALAAAKAVPATPAGPEPSHADGSRLAAFQAHRSISRARPRSAAAAAASSAPPASRPKSRLGQQLNQASSTSGIAEHRRLQKSIGGFMSQLPSRRSSRPHSATSAHGRTKSSAWDSLESIVPLPTPYDASALDRLSHPEIAPAAVYAADTILDTFLPSDKPAKAQQHDKRPATPHASRPVEWRADQGLPAPRSKSASSVATALGRRSSAKSLASTNVPSRVNSRPSTATSKRPTSAVSQRSASARSLQVYNSEGLSTLDIQDTCRQQDNRVSILDDSELNSNTLMFADPLVDNTLALSRPKRLPLEAFDDTEQFEMHSPEGWLALGREMGLDGTPAFSRYHFTATGERSARVTEWEWTKCLVVDFDSATQMYLIQWHDHAGSRKWVRRLNLLFVVEDRDLFFRRIESAVKLRSLAELESEYVGKIMKQSIEGMAPFPDSLKLGALERIGRPLKKKDYAVLEACLLELEAEYVFSMKRTNYELKHVDEPKTQQSTINSEKFAALALSKSGADQDDTSKTLLSQVAVATRDLSDYMFSANSNLQKASIEVLAALRGVLPHKDSFYMFDMDYPCVFGAFSERAEVHCESAQVRLMCEWPRAIATSIETLLGDFFNFRETSIKSYEESRCKSFLRLVNVIMEAQLRNLVIAGLKSFLKLFSIHAQESDTLADHGLPGAPPNEPHSKSQWRRASNGHAGSAQQQAELGDQAQAQVHRTSCASKRQQDTHSAAAAAGVSAAAYARKASFIIMPPSPSRATVRPLFIIHISLEVGGTPGTNSGAPWIIPHLRQLPNVKPQPSNRVILNPDFPQLESALWRLFSLPQTLTTGTIPHIETLVLSSLIVPDSDKHVKSLDAQHELLSIGFASVRDMVKGVWSSIDSLAERYKAFEFLVKDDPSATLARPDATLDDFEAPVKLLVQAQADLATVSSDTVEFPPLILDCSLIKRIYTHLAKSSFEAIQALLSWRIEETCGYLLGVFADLHVHISVDPQEDAETWKQLKVWITRCTRDLDDHTKEFQEVGKVWEFMFQYSMHVADHVSNAYWETFKWPQSMQNALAAAKDRLETARLRILNSIQADKEYVDVHIASLTKQIDSFSAVSDTEATASMLEGVLALRKSVDHILRLSKSVQERETRIGCPVSSFAQLPGMVTKFESYETLWHVASDTRLHLDKWTEEYFVDLDAELMLAKVHAWNKSIRALSQLFNDAISPRQAVNRLKQDVNDFCRNTSVIRALRNPALREWHWEKIAGIIGLSLNDFAGLRLRQVLDLDLELVHDIITDISSEASIEYKLETALQAMKTELTAGDFLLEQFYSPDYLLVKNAQEAGALLQDHQIKSEQLFKTAVGTSVAGKLDQWIRKLHRAQELLILWVELQTQFTRLHPTLTDPDNAAVLGSFAVDAFATACKTIAMVTDMVSKNRKFITLIHRTDLFDIIQGGMTRINGVQDRLQALIDERRTRCPRMYLVSNDEVLDTLSATSVDLLSRFVSKYFDGAQSLLHGAMTSSASAAQHVPATSHARMHDSSAPYSRDLGLAGSAADSGRRTKQRRRQTLGAAAAPPAGAIGNPADPQPTPSTRGGDNYAASQECIFGMISHEGEILSLHGKSRSRASLKESIFAAVAASRSDKAHIALGDFPIQATLLAANACTWEEVERLARDPDEAKVKEFRLRIIRHIETLVAATRATMPSATRVANEALVVTYQASLEAVASLSASAATAMSPSASAAAALPQAPVVLNRMHYSISESTGDISVTFAAQPALGFRCYSYGYEYHGAQGRLVITPSLSQTFLRLFSVLSQNGFPVLTSRACSGKLAAISELAAFTGQMCIAVPCGADTESPALARLVHAFLSMPSWLVFPDIQRMSPKLFPSVIHLLTSIRRGLALAAGKPHGATLTLDDREFQVNTNGAVFATVPSMDLWLKLPARLRSLFRNVAAAVRPDMQVICDVLLTSYGFKNARALASKMCVFIRSLCICSTNQPLDIGMRQVRQILVHASRLRASHAAKSESDALIKAITSELHPMLLVRDDAVFADLLHDVFGNLGPLSNTGMSGSGMASHMPPSSTVKQPPSHGLSSTNQGDALHVGTEESSADPRRLELWSSHIKAVGERLGLCLTDHVLQKTLVLLDTLVCKHTTIALVGDTMSGKTTCWKLAKAALEAWAPRDSRHLRVFHGCPLAVSLAQLSGNASLPDSKLMASSEAERKGMIPTLLQQAIEHASHTAGIIDSHGRLADPAVKDAGYAWVVLDGNLTHDWMDLVCCIVDSDRRTVRMGSGETRNLDHVRLLYESLDLSQASPQAVAQTRIILIEGKKLHSEHIVQAILKRCPPIIERLGAFMLAIHRNMIVPAIQFVYPDNSTNAIDVATERFLVERVFHMLFALLDELGVQGYDRLTDQEQYKTVFDYVFDERVLRWEPWPAPQSSFISGSLAGTENIAWTLDVTRLERFMNLLLRPLPLSTVPAHILLTGRQGVGKTLLGQTLVSRLAGRSTELVTKMFACGGMKLDAFQQRIESGLQVKRRAALGNMSGQRHLAFIDDLNTLSPEASTNHCRILESLRMLLETSSWYSDGEIKSVQDLSIVAVFGQQTRDYALPLRYMRFFTPLAIDDDEEARLAEITLDDVRSLRQATGAFGADLARNVLSGTWGLCRRARAAFRRSPSNPHYLFSLRDMKQIVQLVAQRSLRDPDGQSIIHYWAHAATRLWCDRLTNPQDQAMFRLALEHTIRTDFGMEMQSLLEGEDDPLLYIQPGVVHETPAIKVAATPSHAGRVVATQRLASIDTLLEQVAYRRDWLKQEDIAAVCHPHGLVMAEKIAFSLATIGDSVVLLGGDAGDRQSIVRLAANMADAEYHEYLWDGSGNAAAEQTHWKEWLRGVYVRSIQSTTPLVVVHVDDTYLTDSQWMDVCSMIKYGVSADFMAGILTADIKAIFRARLAATGMATHTARSSKQMPTAEQAGQQQQQQQQMEKGTHVRFAGVEEQTSWSDRAADQGQDEQHAAWNLLHVYADYMRKHIRIVVTINDTPSRCWRHTASQYPIVTTQTWLHHAPHWDAKTVDWILARRLGQAGVTMPPETQTLVTNFLHSTALAAGDIVAFERDKARRQITLPHDGLVASIDAFAPEYSRRHMAQERALGKLKDAISNSKARFQDYEQLQSEYAKWQNTAAKLTSQIEEVLMQMEAKRIEREDAINQVKLDRDTHAALVQELTLLQDAYTTEVDKVTPLQAAAIKEVEALQRSDIYELKGLDDPPNSILLVMDAVMTLVKHEARAGESAWDAARRMISDPRFQRNVVSIDRDQISAAAVHEMERCVRNDEFNSSAVEKLSKAAAALRLWVKAIDRYHTVLFVMQPKKRQFQETEVKVALQAQTVQDTHARITLGETALENMKTTFEALIRQRESTHHKIKELDNILGSASVLVDSLVVTCKQSEKELAETEQTAMFLLGRALLAACTLAYLAPCSVVTKEWARQAWRQRLDADRVFSAEAASAFSFPAFMATGRLRDTYLLYDLTADDHSLETAFICKHHRRFPVVWDSQDNFSKWLKAIDREHRVEEHSVLEEEIQEKIGEAMQRGIRLILRAEQGTVPPAVEKILADLRGLSDTGTRRTIEIQRGLGFETVTVSPAFRLYIVILRDQRLVPWQRWMRQLSSVHTSTELTGVANAVVQAILSAENSELRDRLQHCAVESANKHTRMAVLQSRGVEFSARLQKSDLSGGDLYRTMVDVEQQMSAIQRGQIKDAEEEEAVLEEVSWYERLADALAKVYMVVVRMSRIHPGYLYSLSWFVGLCAQQVKDIRREDKINTQAFFRRIVTLVCSAVAPGFAHADRIVFLFNMARAVSHVNVPPHSASALLAVPPKDRGREPAGPLDVNPNDAGHQWLMPDSHVRFLINAATDSIDIKTRKWHADEFPANPAPEWLSQSQWAALHELAKLPEFSRFAMEFPRYANRATTPIMESSWEDVANASDPFKAILPSRWQLQLSPIERSMVLRCLRPDTLVKSLEMYIQHELGSEALDGSFPADLWASRFRMSSPATPILVISAGMDEPVALIRKYAGRRNMANLLHILSTDRDVRDLGDAAIIESVSKGRWVIVVGYVVSASVMARFLRRMSDIQAMQASMSPNFRLWVICAPHTPVSSALLVSSIKLWVETRRDYRAYLSESFHVIEENILPHEFKPTSAYRNALFNLCSYFATTRCRLSAFPCQPNTTFDIQQETVSEAAKALRAMFTGLSGPIEDHAVFLHQLDMAVAGVVFGRQAQSAWEAQLLSTMFAETMDVVWTTADNETLARMPPI